MNFTFCAFDLEISKEDKTKMTSEILSCPDYFWYFDEFRGCHMLPVFNGGGLKDNTSQGKLTFTSAGDLCPTVKRILEEKIFSFMDPVGRVTVLKTDKNTCLNTHIDCDINEVGSPQHKFRIALQGEIDSLYFLDANNQKVYVPTLYDTYVLDGGHPHAVDPGAEEKITLCVGSPWIGNSTTEYDNLLSNALYSCTISKPEEIKEEWIK
jgi:hypothetical protein